MVIIMKNLLLRFFSLIISLMLVGIFMLVATLSISGCGGIGGSNIDKGGISIIDSGDDSGDGGGSGGIDGGDLESGENGDESGDGGESEAGDAGDGEISDSSDTDDGGTDGDDGDSDSDDGDSETSEEPETRLTIKNECNYTIWIQQQNMPVTSPEVVEIASGGEYSYDIPEAGQAATRFWPKTGCDASGHNCVMGQSSPPCTDCPPPVDSKFEATWGCTLSDQSQCAFTPQGFQLVDTYWNMSAVDGYTLPFTAQIFGNTLYDSEAPCEPVDCADLSFDRCPTDIDLSQGDGIVDPTYASVDLRLFDYDSTMVGCYSPCKYFNYPTYGGAGLSETSPQAVLYCCPTPPISSEECRAGPGGNVNPNDYVTAIHNMCNDSTYAFAYDDNYGLRHCSPETKIEVTFGPNCP